VSRIVPGDDAHVAEAARRLRAGELVALPTETVYGLAADATRGAAVARIFDAKGRPRFNPLISHLADADDALGHGEFDAAARRLAEAFWPGPLTLVVPFRPASPISSLARAGLETIALRVPAHPLARAVIRAAGVPLAAPSANRSGRVSPTRARHVAEELGNHVALILDGGPTEVGLESTIVACLGGPPRLLRPGGLTREAIEAELGHALAERGETGPQPLAPGALSSHYAPDAHLRLDATEIGPGEALLAFGPTPPRGAERAIAVRNLSPSGELSEASANLFDFLRELDAKAARIAVAPIPERGLGRAINDRLRRAAAPRRAASDAP
jgi:L-threonylcarbamoyladenylate synthase